MINEPDYQSRINQLTRKIRNPRLKMDLVEIDTAVGTIQNFRAKWGGSSALLTVVSSYLMSLLGPIDTDARPNLAGQHFQFLGFGLTLWGMYGMNRIILGYAYFFRRERLLLLRKKRQFRKKSEAVQHIKHHDTAAAAIIADVERVK